MRIDLSRRLFTALAASLPAISARAQDRAGDPAGEFKHGLAMHGEPGLPADFSRLPYADPRAKRGGRLVLSQFGTFDSMNPFIIRGQAPPYISGLVVQSLMTRSLAEPFTLYAQVAEAVAVPEDRSSVTFRIDPRARFANGAPVTADDVVFSWSLLRDKGRLQRAPYKRVARADVIDARTARFDLAGAEDRELPLILALMPVLSKASIDVAAFDQPGFAALLGSGPYELANVAPGQSYTLKRRADYWGADIPSNRGLHNFDEIRVEFYRDANGMFEAFKAGLVDFWIETDAAKWAQAYDFPAVRDGRVAREEFPIGIAQSINGFVMNTRSPIFADVRVREAMTLMFDGEWVKRNLFSDAQQRMQSYFDASQFSSHGRPASARERAWLAKFPGAVRADILEHGWSAPTTNGTGRDRAVAKAAVTLLTDAGCRVTEDGLRTPDGQPFTFEILVGNRNRLNERLAITYAQMLRRIGVDARVRLMDDIQYWMHLADFAFDMTPYKFSPNSYPGLEQSNRWSKAAAATTKSLAYAGVRSDAVDAMIDQMRTARGAEEYRDAVRALDRVLLSGFYVTPLFFAADQWTARWTSIRRPEHPPLQGLSPEMLWREDPA